MRPPFVRAPPLLDRSEAVLRTRILLVDKWFPRRRDGRRIVRSDKGRWALFLSKRQREQSELPGVVN